MWPTRPSTPGTRTSRRSSTKIKNSGADAVLLWTAGKEGAAIVKAARRPRHRQLPLYGGSGQAKLEFAQGAGPAAEGFVFGTGKSLMPSNWGDGYRRSSRSSTASPSATRTAYGQPPDIFAGHAFDALAILAGRAASGPGGDTDPAKLTKAIEATKDLIGFGGAFTFSPTEPQRADGRGPFSLPDHRRRVDDRSSDDDSLGASRTWPDQCRHCSSSS